MDEGSLHDDSFGVHVQISHQRRRYPGKGFASTITFPVSRSLGTRPEITPLP